VLISKPRSNKELTYADTVETSAGIRRWGRASTVDDDHRHWLLVLCRVQSSKAAGAKHAPLTTHHHHQQQPTHIKPTFTFFGALHHHGEPWRSC